MRIEQLTLKHFKGFEYQELSFHPEFNLLIGQNGTGKTSALDALAVAVGSWFMGIKGADTRHIRPNEVMLLPFLYGETAQENHSQEVSWEYQFPCEIVARGSVLGQSMSVANR